MEDRHSPMVQAVAFTLGTAQTNCYCMRRSGCAISEHTHVRPSAIEPMSRMCHIAHEATSPDRFRCGFGLALGCISSLSITQRVLGIRRHPCTRGIAVL
jgi:hypothetical protein